MPEHELRERLFGNLIALGVPKAMAAAGLADGAEPATANSSAKSLG
jgi:hypothetical protein